MEQTKVTEYFSTRKRTFSLIQPSKKLKLDSECVPECKTSLVSPSISKPRTLLSNSVKRLAKRKHVAVSTGNIKSFFDNSACHKMPKLGQTSGKTLSSNAMLKPSNSIHQEKALVSPSLGHDTLKVQQVKVANDLKKMSIDGNIVDAKSVTSSHKRVEQPLLKKPLNVDLKEATPVLSSNNKPFNAVSGNVENFSKTKKDKQTLLLEKIKNFKKAVSEVKVPEKVETSAPAYQRFKSLSLIDSEHSLVMPFKYKVLEEMFRATETVVSMLYNRKEVCSFAKVKLGVQQMTKRNFDRNVLGQIASVFPSAYVFNLEKGIKSYSSTKVKPCDSQLTITPNITSKHNLNGSQCTQVAPHVLLERRKTFHVNLLLSTKEHHEKFLANLQPPLCMPSDKIMRWHPKFPVDDVPDITASPLPEPVEFKVSTVQDVLDRVKGVVGERITKALKSVAEEKASVPVNPVAPTRVTSGALKGISQALLDKIRNKESAKLTREMLRAPESEKRIEMLSKLPEFVRILRTFFVLEKRAAIALEDAMVKVADSFHAPISPGEVEKHLRLLSQVVPKWLIFLTIPKGVFIKIDKKMNVEDILNVINDEIKKEKL